MQLTERFNQESDGLRAYLQLEVMLLSGEVYQYICQQYREVNATSLSSQLAVFSDQNK
jgi:hypothetical protein